MKFEIKFWRSSRCEGVLGLYVPFCLLVPFRGVQDPAAGVQHQKAVGGHEGDRCG